MDSQLNLIRHASVQGAVFQCRFDPGWTVIRADDSLFRFLGYSREEFATLFDSQMAGVIHPDDQAIMGKIVMSQLERSNLIFNENRLICKDGTERWIWISAERMWDEQGESYFYCMFYDISRQKQIQNALASNEQRYDAILSQTEDIVYEWNCETGEFYSSSYFQGRFGYIPPADGFPQAMTEGGYIYPDDSAEFLALYSSIQAGAPSAMGEFRIRTDKGDYLWCKVSAAAILDGDGKPRKVVGMVSDIDAQKREILSAQEKMRRDALTGLYNRAATEELVNTALRTKSGMSALMVIDVDNFKGVNDTFGHIYGDAVLGEMAAHLKRLKGPNDVVGRVGGDEFLFLMGQITTQDEAEEKAQAIGEVFRRSFGEHGAHYSISASVGIAFSPRNGNNYRTLFEQADAAAYASKTGGKNRYTVFHEGLVQADGRMPRRREEEITPEQKNFRDNIFEYVFRIFYENREAAHAMEVLLDLIGTSFQQDRIHIFEQDEVGLTQHCTFEWCAPGVHSVRTRCGAVGLNTSLWHEDAFDANGLYLCEDTQALPESVGKQWLLDRGTKSVLLYRIREGDNLAAVIGFENCQQPKTYSTEEQRTLALVAQTISMFLLRARRQERLEQQKRFAERLLARNTACIYAIDPETYRIIYANASVCQKICGTHIGEICYRALRGKEEPCSDCPMQELRGEDDTVVKDLYHPQINMWTQTTATSMEWENGERVCLISMNDITRYRAESSRLKFISESIPGGLMGGFLEVNMPLYFINKAMLTFLGYESEEAFSEATGGLLLNCVHPADRQRITEELHAFYHSRRTEFQSVLRLVDKTGELKWILYRGKRVSAENGRDTLFSLCLDMTSQKEMENQLALYRNASRGGAFRVCLDDKLTLLYANDIFYQVHGYTADELKTKLKNHCIDTIVPEDKARVLALLNRAKAEGRSTVDWEMAILLGDGTRRWLRINASLERNEGVDVINGFVSDLTVERGLQEALVRSEARYRIALQQAEMNLWEYDMATRQLVHTDKAERDYDIPEIVENAPHPLIESGFIHAEDGDSLVRMYQQMEEGVSNGVVSVRGQARDGKSWRWEKLSFTNILDPKGVPVRTVIVGEDVTLQREAEIHYQQEIQLRSIYAEGILASSRVNLTADRVETLQQKGQLPQEPGDTMDYQALMEIGASVISSTEDRQRYVTMLSRENLIRAFGQGTDTVSVEYRRSGADGRLSWVSATQHLARKSDTGEIYAYGSIRDVSEQKAMELALRRRAQLDALTGVYNQDTAMGMMEESLERVNREGKGHYLLLVNVDRFSRVVHEVGYQAADRVLKELGTLLQMKFSGEKIVGRLYGEEFSVWLGGDIQPQRIRRAAEEIRQTMCMPYMFPEIGVPLSVCIGGAAGDRADSLTTLMHRARLALRAAKDGGKNSCVFYDQLSSVQIPASAVGEPVVFQGRETETVLLRCAYALTSSLDIKKSLEQVLWDLADYYQADRASLLEIKRMPERQVRFYDWLDHAAAERRGVDEECLYDTGANWLDLMSGNRRMVFEQAELIQNECSDTYERLSRQGVRSAYALPLEMDGTVVGYLGINNARHHRGDLSLLESLRHFVVNELFKRQMQEQQEYLGYHDALTGLLNRDSYLRYISNLEPDCLLSLGVTSVDINGLKHMNSQYGHEYGDQIVKATADSLLNALDRGRVFRFAGDEFLAICENLSLDTFTRQVETFREKMERDYPQSIALGYVWADTDINPERLITHAEERMTISKQNYYRTSGRGNRRYDPAMLQKLLTELREGMYHMYLQPKAVIATGKIAGAEALVRYIHPVTGLKSPDRFIPQLERGGVISNVDLFIFEQVCKTLYQWGKQGRRLIPISLNFSRATLLEDRLMQQVEEIYSRYSVPRELVEIEITESVTGVERETMIQICEEIVRRSFRLSLDDFGAKYSNLSILSSIPLHVLKLDKSLVNDLSTNNSTRVVVRNFLSACRELEIQSVAEGVETSEQLEVLRELGCDYAQGYYFNKPIPLEEFELEYLS